MHHSPRPRVATTTLGALALAAGSLLVALPAAADVDLGPGYPCTGDQDVTVVVDFTDLGGEIEFGCATAGATGSEALVEAGFADTRDEYTMICAIDGAPDPCPAEFTGVYWSYWYGADGAWESYLEGSDTAVTAAGGFEGWRYFDGSEGPGVVPAAGEATPTDTEPTEAEPTDPEPTEAEPTEAEPTDTEPTDTEPTDTEPIDVEPISADADDTGGLSTAALAGIGVAAVLVVAAVVLGLRRRRADLAGPDATDSSDPADD